MCCHILPRWTYFGCDFKDWGPSCLFHHLVQAEEVDVVQECVPILGHSSRDHGVRAHSPDCDALIRRPPPLPIPPSLQVTRSGCLNPGIRINPTVPSCAPELRDFFFTYLEISLVKPCGFLWWARFLRFDLGLGVPDWSLIGRHRAHMSTLIQYSLQENPMNIDLIVTQ